MAPVRKNDIGTEADILFPTVTDEIDSKIQNNPNLYENANNDSKKEKQGIQSEQKDKMPLYVFKKNEGVPTKSNKDSNREIGLMSLDMIDNEKSINHYNKKYFKRKLFTAIIVIIVTISILLVAGIIFKNLKKEKIDSSKIDRMITK